MKALTDKLEWIVAGIVVLVCGVLIFMDLNTPDNESLDSLIKDDKAIKEALASNQVDPNWPWSPAN
ncbi:MAG: hypothetical protein KIS92_25885, partial [Planctomycetota bacterium]|nr:hypothetical protein [Planctomycetota bacterium]